MVWRTRFFDLVLFFILITPDISIAQSADADGTEPIRKRQISQDGQQKNQIRMRQGASPRAFVPYVINDQNGNAVPLDRKINLHEKKTGKFFKQITLKRYLGELNQFEQELNYLGMSLRDEKQHRSISEVAIDRNGLKEQEQQMRLSMRSSNPKSGLIDDIVPLTPVTHSSDKNLRADKSRSWSFNHGDARNFQVFGEASVRSMADASESATKQRTRTQTSFGARVFDSDAIQLGRATVDVVSKEDENKRATVRFEILGNEIFRQTKTDPIIAWPQVYSKTINFEHQFPFTIAVIPCLATVGILGTAQAGWQIGTNFTGIQSHTNALAKTESYARVTTGVWIADIGVGGAVQLLGDELRLQNDNDVTFDANSKPIALDLKLYSYNQIESLSGRLFAYVSFPMTQCEGAGFYDWMTPSCYFTNTTWEQNFYNWTGFAYRGNIIDYKYHLEWSGERESGLDAKKHSAI